MQIRISYLRISPYPLECSMIKIVVRSSCRGLGDLCFEQVQPYWYWSGIPARVQNAMLTML